MDNIGCCCGIDEAINYIIRTCPEDMLKQSYSELMILDDTQKRTVNK